MSDSEYSVIKSDIIKIFDCTVIALRVGLEVIKLEFILNLKIKHNDWLLADMCLQATNHCALFSFYSSSDNLHTEDGGI